MKTNARQNLLRMLLVCIMMTFSMVLARPYQAQAKLVKVKTRVVTEKTSDKEAVRGARTVKKGRSKVVFRQTGIVKFKAPKSRKYRFTFTKLSNNSALEKQAAAAIIMNSKLHQYKLKTQYGKKKVPNLYLGTDKFIASVRSVSGKNYLRVRSGAGTIAYTHTTSLTLKKGQVIYIICAGFDRKASYTMRLNIQ